MFAAEKNILFITQNRVRAGRVRLGKRPQLTKVLEYQWNWQNLPQTLLEIKKKLGDDFRIGVDESFVYVTSFLIPTEGSSGGKERQVVQNYASQLIPENIAHTLWDFKDISSHLIAVPEGQKLVQFVGGTHTFFAPFLDALHKVELHYEDIEPISFAVARLVANSPEPTLIVHVAEKITLTLVDDRCVIITETIPQLTKPQLDQFISFNTEKLHITPTLLLFTGNASNVNPQEYQTDQLQVGNLEAEPMVGLALKSDLKGSDNQVLNLDAFLPKSKPTVLTEAPSSEEENEAEINQPPTTTKKLSPVIIFFLFLLWLATLAVTTWLAKTYLLPHFLKNV